MVKPPFGLAAWRVLALATWAFAALTAYRARPQTKVGPSAVSAVSAPAGDHAAPSAIAASATIETVSSLGERHDDDALATLIAIADHGAPAVQDAAIDGIVQIGGKEARSYLAQRMSDAPEGELSQIARALARTGGVEAHEILFRAARSARPALRTEARTAIATLDTPDVRAFMLEQLQDAEPEPAVIYFADCADARAIPALERLARDSAADLRSSAITALFAQGDAGNAAVTRLLDENGELADAVLQSNLPTPAAHRAVLTASIARLRRGGFSSGPVFDFLGHDFSSEGLNALAAAAREEATASSAITALQTRGDAAALNVLARLANDANRTVSDNATCALVSAPDSRSRSYLLRLDEHMRSAVTTALADIDAPEAAGFLARLRLSANTDDREAALRLIESRSSGPRGRGSDYNTRLIQ